MIHLTCRSEVTGLAFSPDGAFLAASCDRSVTRIWNVVTGIEVMTLATPFMAITSICYSPDGSLLAVGGVMTPGGPVQWWRLADPSRPMRSDPHDLRCKGVAFAPEGRHLYSFSYSALFRHRLDDPAVDRRYLCDGILALALDAFGHPVLLRSSGDVERLEPDLSRPHRVTGVPAPVGRADQALQIISLPRRAGVALTTGTALAVWDGPPAKTPRIADGRGASINRLAITPDVRNILTGGADGFVIVWDFDSLQRCQEIDWKIGDILSLAVSPDGLTAAAGGINGDIIIWDLEI